MSDNKKPEKLFSDKFKKKKASSKASSKPTTPNFDNSFDKLFDSFGAELEKIMDIKPKTGTSQKDAESSSTTAPVSSTAQDQNIADLLKLDKLQDPIVKEETPQPNKEEDPFAWLFKDLNKDSDSGAPAKEEDLDLDWLFKDEKKEATQIEGETTKDLDFPFLKETAGDQASKEPSKKDDDFNLDWLLKDIKENTKEVIAEEPKIIVSQPILESVAPPIAPPQMVPVKSFKTYITCAAITIAALLLVEGFVYMYYFSGKQPSCYGAKAIVAKLYSGEPILIGTDGIAGNGKEVITQGYLNAKIGNILHSLVKPTDTVIDIGAGFGHYTIYLASLVGQKGTVYSFEARRDVFSLLETSLLINKLQNVKAYNKLLFSTDTPVWVELSKESGNFGNAKIVGHYWEMQNTNKLKLYPAQAETLDSALPNLSNISLIHINASGNEVSIIMGATKLISRSSNIKIITSWNDKHDATTAYKEKADLFNYMTELGFRFWFVKQDKNEMHEISKDIDLHRLGKGLLIISRNL